MRTMLCTSPSHWSTTYCYAHHVVYITKSLEYNLLLCAPCCVHHQVLGVQPIAMRTMLCVHQQVLGVQHIAMRTMLCTSPSPWSTTYCYAHHVVYITKSLEYNLLLCAPCNQVLVVQPIAMRYCYAHHVVYITKSLEYNLLLCAPCCVHHQVLGVQPIAMRTMLCTSPSPWSTTYCYAHHVVYITKSLEYNLLLCAPCCVHHQVLGVQHIAMRTMLCTSPSPWSTTYCYAHHVVYITKSLEYNMLLCAPCCVHHQVLGVQPIVMRTKLCASPSPWSTTYCYAHHVVYITKSLEYNLLLCAPCCVHHQVLGVQPIAMCTMLCTSPSHWSTTYCYAHHVVYITKSLEYNLLLCAPCCVHHQVLGVQPIAMRTMLCTSPSPWSTTYCYAHHVVYFTKSLEYNLLLCAPCCVHHQVIGVQPIAMRTMLCTSPSHWSTTYCYAHHVVYITKSLEYNLLLCAPCCVHHQVLGVQPIAMRTMLCVHQQVLGVQHIAMRTMLCTSPSPWSTTYCYAHHVVYITKSLEYNLLLCAPCNQVLVVQPIAMRYCYAHHVVYITKSLEYNILLCAPCCVHHQVLGVQPIAMRTMLCTSPSPWSTTYCYAHHVVYITKSLEYNLLLCAPCCVHHQVLGVVYTRPTKTMSSASKFALVSF